MKLEDLGPQATVRGVLPDVAVTVVNVQWFGSDARAHVQAVRRPEPLQLDLFGETPLPADQEVDFYDVRVEKQKDGTYIVGLRGVDIYDPISGEVHSTRGEDVAAWFLDTDYDGKTFHICQAFFPGDGKAWEKLERALKAQIDPEAFERMRGTVSLPFLPGEHKRIAVKVIDFRGNEVVRVILTQDGVI